MSKLAGSLEHYYFRFIPPTVRARYQSNPCTSFTLWIVLPPLHWLVINSLISIRLRIFYSIFITTTSQNNNDIILSQLMKLNLKVFCLNSYLPAPRLILLVFNFNLHYIHKLFYVLLLYYDRLLQKVLCMNEIIEIKFLTSLKVI